jgi:acetylornithine/succinyldiaminopimelate/putrescine aminotransferase/predicted amino acid dehydrogenase/acyl carrier protein
MTAVRPHRITREELTNWLLRYLNQRLGLDLTDIGATDDAAALGLDSLEVEQMIGELERWLGRELDATAILRLPTLEAFLTHVLEGDVLPEAREHLNPFLHKQLQRMRFDKVFVRADGSYLEDAAGQRYLDFVCGYGAVPFGHTPREIWDAITAVRNNAEPNLVQLSVPAAATELAQRITALLPAPLRRVTFANSGAETVEAAIKLARLSVGRQGILCTSNAFHGKTLGALSATGNTDYQAGSGAPTADFVHVPYGDLEALDQVLRERPGYFAALIVEPIQGEGGVIVPPPGYLRAAAERCRAAGAVVIVDEVQTGLGRTGELFAFEHEGFVPDILLLAKALSGGVVPIGACVSSTAVFNEAFALKHSSTFAGNTLACRAAIAALNIITRDDCALIRQARSVGDYLRERLHALASKYPGVLAEVRGRGLMLGLHIAVDDPEHGRSILKIACEQGLAAPLVAGLLLNVEHVRVALTLNNSNVLRVQPPLTTTQTECDFFVDALDRTLALVASSDTAAIARGLLHGEKATALRAGPATVARKPASRFGFVIHPLTASDYRHFPLLHGELDERDLRAVAELAADALVPFLLDDIEIRGRDGTVASGILAVVPRTAQQLLAAGEQQAGPLVARAVELCRERGARLVGLGGYTAVVTRGGARVRGADYGITTGNAYTAVAACDAAAGAVQALHGGWSGLSVAVIGAAGSVGRNVAALAAEHCERLFLVGNPRWDQSRAEQRLTDAALDMLRHLVRSRDARGALACEVHNALSSRDVDDAALASCLRQLRDCGRIVLASHAQAVLPFASVVFAATSTPTKLFDAADFRHQAIVCDVSRPPNLPPGLTRERPDLVQLHGGMVHVPSALGLRQLGLHDQQAYACLAETMLLALDGEERDFSIGARVSTSQLLRVRELAEQHGVTAVLPDTKPRDALRQLHVDP